MSELGKSVGQQKSEIPCPRCGKAVTVLAKLLIDGGSTTCPHCREKFQIDSSLGAEVNRRHKGLFENRTIKIKF